jgi:small multidrug resistance pump
LNAPGGGAGRQHRQRQVNTVSVHAVILNTFPLCLGELTRNARNKEMSMRWVLLSMAILSEVCGSTCMKLSNGFSNIYASILTFVFYGISFSIFIFALKHFDLSFIYALWAGIGILLVSAIGMAFFKESISMMKIVAILVIFAGVVMLNLCESVSHP